MSPLARRELTDYNERRRRLLFTEGSKWRRFLRWLGLTLR